MDIRPVKYADFQTRINRFKVRDVLLRCSTMSNWADGFPPGKALIQARMADSSVLKTVVAPSALAFIAKTSLLRSSDNRQRRLTDEEFATLLAMQGELEDPFVRGDDVDIDGFLVRTAWEQFPLQEANNRMIPRTLMLLKDANIALGRTPIDVEAAWEKMTDLSLERFVMVGFGYLSGVWSHGRVSRHLTSREEFAGRVTVEDCEACLRLISATYDEFRELSAPYRIDDSMYAKTEFNVLAQRPLIAVGDELIAPVPKLLLLRITDGLRYDLREHFREGRANPFSEYFGKLFEQYTGELLKWAFGEDKVFPEPAYGKPQKRGPDWVVVDGEMALLFECRTSGLALKSKTIGDPKQIREDLGRILVDTAVKYPQKVDDLRRGATGIDVTGVIHFVPIVITYEPAYVEPILRGLAARELDERAQEYNHIDISNLETLVGWRQGACSIGQILEQWQLTCKINPQEFGVFLNGWANEHNLDYRNDLLDRRMRVFVEEQLGRPYPPDPDVE